MKTPAEKATALADDLAFLAKRLRESEDGHAVFTKEDVDRIVESRLGRERRIRGDIERERDELLDEVAALHDEISTLRHQLASLD